MINKDCYYCRLKLECYIISKLVLVTVSLLLCVQINAGGNSTSFELMECKRTVLKPYLIFLKFVSDNESNVTIVFINCS